MLPFGKARRLCFLIWYRFSVSKDILINEDVEGDIFLEHPNLHIDTDVGCRDVYGSG